MKQTTLLHHIPHSVASQARAAIMVLNLDKRIDLASGLVLALEPLPDPLQVTWLATGATTLVAHLTDLAAGAIARVRTRPPHRLRVMRALALVPLAVDDVSFSGRTDTIQIAGFSFHLS